MKLFISHATEDKIEFVRPLAEALAREYEVWYDQYELTIGDSLLKKINEGLAACDFAVVVLSQYFFTKKWPQAELDGLFALETTSRKIILPVWKDISEEEVRAFSPILAGRFAAKASEGVESVVGQIKQAVQASERTRRFAPLDSALDRFRTLDHSMKQKADSDALTGSVNGARIVEEQFRGLYRLFETILSKINETQSLRLNIYPVENSGFHIKSSVQLDLRFGLKELYVNSASDCVLVVNTYRCKFNPEGDFDGSEMISTREFKPFFKSPSEMVWTTKCGDRSFSNEELAEYLIEGFRKEIEKRSHSA